MYVYVLSRDSRPLMPCSRRKARILLKTKKAKVVRRTPFTIRLLYGSSGYKQDITLGVDAGSKHVGLSASTEKMELFAADLRPRNDVVKLLSERRQYRRSRRSRTTRYRQARFNNRVKSKHRGWLAPSVEVKIQEHISVIKRICRLLPITKVIVETAEFDIHRLKAMLEGKPIPVGIDYQMGEMYDEYNVRQYVLKRDGYACRCCGVTSTEKRPVKFHVHHIETRKTGGNAPNNLITLCSDCHRLLHEGKLKLPEGTKRLKPMRDAAFMGIMRKTLVTRLADELGIPVYETFGYITKCRREKYNISKNHVNDALCIAGHPGVLRVNRAYLIRPVRNHNRRLHKATILKGGVRKSNQAHKYVKGYRLFDKVSYKGIECFIWGRRASGSFLLKELDGTKVKDGVGYKYLKLLERSSNYLIT